jgi:hypothetical protein
MSNKRNYSLLATAIILALIIIYRHFEHRPSAAFRQTAEQQPPATD